MQRDLPPFAFVRTRSRSYAKVDPRAGGGTHGRVVVLLAFRLAEDIAPGTPLSSRSGFSGVRLVPNPLVGVSGAMFPPKESNGHAHTHIRVCKHAHSPSTHTCTASRHWFILMNNSYIEKCIWYIVMYLYVCSCSHVALLI